MDCTAPVGFVVLPAVMRTLLALIVVVTTGCRSAPSSAPAQTTSVAPPSAPIAWQHWSAETFARAKADKKIVVVAIETQWCHWCHVMDEQTWSDPALRALVAERFVAIREDADARPDLAERYADWGWPALALLSPDAQPITELRGYQDKVAFTALLSSLVHKLDRGQALERPATSVSTAAATPLDAIYDIAQKQLDASYDKKRGGWGAVQKYPFYAPVEQAFLHAFLRGDDEAAARGAQSMTAELALIDPVDGGMFQYSLDSVWTAPHYEKLAEVNGNALGSLARAFSATRDDAYRQGGDHIAAYLARTLRDPVSHAFYANQDADVGTRGDRPFLIGKSYYALDAAGRRAAGAPFVDTHVYASHNGRIIAGLARFAAATANAEWLTAAADAARAIEQTHAAPGRAGAFVHAAGDSDVHLADQVAMGHAYLELYEASGDPVWRERARAVAGALRAFHDDKAGGFFEHPPGASDVLAVRKPIKQNAEAARFLLKLGRLDDDEALKGLALGALAAFSNPAAVEDEGRTIGEYLLALEEARAEPLHFAIVSAHDDDDSTRALVRAALDLNAPHRIEEIVAPG
ncbi:MAG TPA: DUF255 domain-containing protein, partial [Myxococcota bacterium]